MKNKTKSLYKASFMPRSAVRSSSSKQKKSLIKRKFKKNHLKITTMENSDMQNKMGYFYTPYRKDLFGENSRCMNFNSDEEQKQQTWNKISNMILKSDQKPLDKTLSKLRHFNTISSRRRGIRSSKASGVGLM